MKMNENNIEKYKPSVYNHWVDQNGSVILYNSLYGVKGIKKYSSEHKNKIIAYLKKEEIICENDPVLQSLIENGYIVPANCDESLFLNKLYLKCINGNILHLVILPTEQCNFRCKYCYESFSRGRMSDETIRAIIKYVRINISKYSGLKVSWFGGEPSMEINTICEMSREFIAICKTAKRRYWADITSNGYLIDLENFKKLYKANVFNYQITIDGIESTHDQQRVLRNGEKSFDKIIDNLISIKENSECKHWQITIRTNFSKPIFEHIDEYISLYYDLFGEDKRFIFLCRPAGDWGGESIKSYTDNLLQTEGFANVFRSILQHAKSLDISRHLYFLNPGGSVCLASGANTFLIDSSGTIRKCSCHLDDDRNTIGHVMPDGTFQINQYDYCNWIRDRWREEKCNNCFFLPACLNASCPANYVLSRNDPNQCHVYEKVYLDHILAIFDKQGQIPEVFI